MKHPGQGIINCQVNSVITSREMHTKKTNKMLNQIAPKAQKNERKNKNEKIRF